jgi:hypothetical protein
VELAELPNDAEHLELAAIAASGARIAMQVAKPQGQGEFLSVEDVYWNSRSELIAITRVYSNGNGVGLLAANNLTRQSLAPLSTGEGSEVIDHISFGGRELISVQESLPHPEGTTDPVQLKLVNADTGEPVRLKNLDYPVSGKFGTNRAGELKILLLGYELFGVLDAFTGDFQQLVPPRQQPSDYPAILELASGTYVEFSTPSGVILYDIPALFEGLLKPVRAYPAGTEFVGGKKPWAAVAKRSLNGKPIVSIENVATRRVIGAFAESAFPYAHVGDVVVHGGGAVAVLSAPFNPNSYVQGTILNYLELPSGKVLRSRTSKEIQLLTELKELSPGKLVGIERLNQYELQPSGVTVADLFAGSVLSQSDQVYLVGPTFQTARGELLGVTGKEGTGICVADLLELSQATCISDPLVTGAIEYGYGPFETGTGTLILPLLGSKQGFNFPSFGYVEYQVQ